MNNFNNVTLPKEEKIAKKADIMFVIDNSQSVEKVKDEVHNHICSLTEKLKKDLVDARVGFVFYGHDNIYIKKPVNSAEDFKKAFNEIRTKETGWNEFTLPAIDLAADIEWRDDAHRYIIVFTNEDIYGGYEPDEQMAQFDKVLEKLQLLNIRVFYIGADCDYYRKFQDLPGSLYIVTENFNDIDFDDLFNVFGKSISANVEKLNIDNKVEKDIFNVRDFSTFMVRVFEI